MTTSLAHLYLSKYVCKVSNRESVREGQTPIPSTIPQHQEQEQGQEIDLQTLLAAIPKSDPQPVRDDVDRLLTIMPSVVLGAMADARAKKGSLSALIRALYNLILARQDLTRMSPPPAPARDVTADILAITGGSTPAPTTGSGLPTTTALCETKLQNTEQKSENK